MEAPLALVIDTHEINNSPQAVSGLEAWTNKSLLSLVERELVKEGEMVTILTGEYAHTGMKVMKLDSEFAILRVSPKNETTIRVAISELYKVSKRSDPYWMDHLWKNI